MTIDLLSFVRGCTFDDFLFTPQYSVVERRDPARIELGCRLSTNIRLARPIVSANMDSVTRAEMAIVQAEEGGIGIIDRGFRDGDIEPQVREVGTVKRTQHGVIADPHTIAPEASLQRAVSAMHESGVGTLIVVDPQRRLLGLLSERDARFVRPDATVAERMTPASDLIVHIGEVSSADAEALMVRHKIKKLPLVDADGLLLGLITAKDILKQRKQPFATRDQHGRLRVGAAIGARGDFLERAAELIKADVDVIVIDIAHGHSVVMERALKEFRRKFGDVELIAGTVGTAEGARFLLERGVNGIKVGIGPGGGCTTRISTSFGVPQVQALVECRHAIGADSPVSLIADGGIHRDGALVQALMFGGDCVMLGSAFAGTLESPGEVVQKPVLLAESRKPVQVPFKVLRGMASLGAIKDRLDVEDADLQALGAEGTEVSVPVQGSARAILQEMTRHLCSAISYGGGRSLDELRQMFRDRPERYLVKLSQSAGRESYER
jgi:IMP dehydrogenase